jgi:uncharacterized protein YbjT (DUF2867 family)
MAKILVTGSTGFIGKRLIYLLLEQGHEVYALSRLKGITIQITTNPNLHIVFGDVGNPDFMDPFPKDIDATYYLIHSMGDVGQDLISVEEKIAENFVSAIEQTSCKQIIFMGGIIEDEAKLSPHLMSRLSVERVLKSSKIPCTVLRSSIIIGAGSASFEIIRDLDEKLPVMIAPKWVKSFCQPISISDVLFYLTGVLSNTLCFGKTFDIGGPEGMSFKDILLRYAAFRGLKRYIIDVPFLTPRLSSYWLVFITSVKFSICKHLVESMKHDTRKLNLAIDQILPHDCLRYEEALHLAFQKIAQNEVVSTWMDAWDPKTVTGNIQEFIEVPKEGCLIDAKALPINIPIHEVRKRLWSIGGKRGWYSMNWAWRFRGLLDQFAGGTGLNRGRRDPEKIGIGDSIDFWRVIVADEKKGHLILFAEMKLPGEAWLEFKIDEEQKILNQTATFRPKGFWGYTYWYMMYPFHIFIFGNMAKAIAQEKVEK